LLKLEDVVALSRLDVAAGNQFADDRIDRSPVGNTPAEERAVGQRNILRLRASDDAVRVHQPVHPSDCPNLDQHFLGDVGPSVGNRADFAFLLAAARRHVIGTWSKLAHDMRPGPRSPYPSYPMLGRIVGLMLMRGPTLMLGPVRMLILLYCAKALPGQQRQEHAGGRDRPQQPNAAFIGLKIACPGLFRSSGVLANS
jgi:hypothetical protein